MPRKTVVVALALLTLLCIALATRSAHAQATAPYVSPALGVSFPTELGGLRLIRITDFEPRQRGLGVGVYYNHQQPFVAVDIFIYDKADAVPSGYDPPEIRAEALQAIADIHTVATSGLYADVRVFSGPVACQAGGMPYQCQCASLEYLRTPQGQPAVRTRSLLRGIKGNFVKLG